MGCKSNPKPKGMRETADDAGLGTQQVAWHGGAPWWDSWGTEELRGLQCWQQPPECTPAPPCCAARAALPQALTTSRASGLAALLQRRNVLRTSAAVSAHDIPRNPALPTVTSSTSLARHWDSSYPAAQRLLHSTYHYSIQEPI